MVYIAPPHQNRQAKRQQQPATEAGKAPRAKADQQDAGNAARGSKNAKQGHVQSLEAVKSKQDLLEELTRQAEWHTVVLQREQAALRALQESKAGGYGAQSSQDPSGSSARLAVAGFGYDSGSTGALGGLKPVAVKSNNHIFLNVAPKVVDPSKVPGLGGPAAPPAAAAARQRAQAPQQQQPAARGPPAPSRQLTKQQQPPARQQQVPKPAVNSRNAAGKQKQQPGRNAQQQQKQQPLAKGKAQNQRAAAGPAVHDDFNDEEDGASPFAEADWKYDFPSDGGAPPAPGMRVGLPPGGNFRTGQEFEVPQSNDGAAAVQQQPAAGGGGGRGGPGPAGHVPVSVGDYALIGGRPAQQQQQQGPPSWQQQQQQPQQQQQQRYQEQQQQQRQQQQRYQQQQQRQQQVVRSPADELEEQLQEAEGHPDPAMRQRLIKEIRQKQYKLELEQQIADREAARQADKAAAAAKEAAEEARRAAAPPPWDPAVRAAKRGGGGEPLRDADGAPVANLRAIKSQQALHAEASQPQYSASQQQQQQQLPSWPSQGQLHGPGSTGGLQQSASTVDVGGGTGTARGHKGFMGALSELKPGLSEEQQHAAAAARQQLLADLEAQIADKQARAAAQAAADAAQAAQEEEALRRYYTQQQQQQSPAVNSVTSPQGGLVQEPSKGLGFAGNSAGAGLGSSGYAANLTGRKGRAKHVIEAPWLDQAPQQQQQQQQRPPGLQHEASGYNAGVYSTPNAVASAADVSALPSSLIQQQRSVQRQLGAAAGNADSQHLAVALQELQEEQQMMWQEFTKQQQALEQLMQDKQAVAEEAHAAKAELERLRGALEQQHLLQQEYEGQQQQQQRPRQQRDVLQQQQLEMSGSLQRDALDAFVVETHMVPLSMNALQENDSFMQLVAAQPAVAGNSTLRQSQPLMTARQHLSRYNSFYGHEAEASNISAASEAQLGSPRGSWGGWPRPAQGQRPPPSPPILRSDKFVDKQPVPAASSSNKKGGGKVSRVPRAPGKSRSPVRRQPVATRAAGSGNGL